MQENQPSTTPPANLSRRALVAAVVAGSAAAVVVTPAVAQADSQWGDADTVARAARPQAPECLADLAQDGVR